MNTDGRVDTATVCVVAKARPHMACGGASVTGLGGAVCVSLRRGRHFFMHLPA